MNDLNCSTIEDFKKIKGVGSKMAQKIIVKRDEDGGFKSVEDLKKVDGLGDKIIERFKNEFVVKNDSNEKKNEKKEGVRESLSDLKNKSFCFLPKKYRINPNKINEAHLVGDFNDWDPANKDFPLFEFKKGCWMGMFKDSFFEKGQEYKIMYNSIKWEDGLNVGDENGGNLKI